MIKALINTHFPHKDETIMMIKDGVITSFEETLPEDFDGEIIDSHGATLYPGFIDAHMHLAWYGQLLHSLTLFECDSHIKIQSKIKTYIQDHPKLEILQAKGYNDGSFKNEPRLTRHDLDLVVSHIPTVVTRVCNHVVVVNTNMLEKIVNHFEQDLDDTYFEKDDHGAFTGVIKELGIGYVNALLPTLTTKDYLSFLKTAAQKCLSYGITTVGTNDLWMHNPEYLMVKEAYEHFSSEKQLRVSHQIKMDELTDFEVLQLDPIKENDFQFSGPCKMFADGSLGGKTALMSQPYLNTQTYGESTIDQDHLEALVKKANEHSMQVVVHAIGDQAIDNVAKAYAPFTRAGNPLRHTIIHIQITRPEQIASLANLNIMGMVQPVFLRSDAPLLKERLPQTIIDHSYAWKSMINNGMKIAFSSDAPIEDPNVFVGMHSAMKRIDAYGVFPQGHQPSQCLDLDNTLNHFTKLGAYLLHQEHHLGQLEVGYKADCFASHVPLDSLNDEELLNHHVLWTMVDGKIVYQKDKPE
jgi:predicted amidohydrolase YtcJ